MHVLRLASVIALALLGSAAAMPRNASASTTQYRVTFNATWSAATHPYEFPFNPHFSGLIGGTHSDQVVFWQSGALASLGIQNMAELGSKSALADEVQAAITAGTAYSVLSGFGISPSPGSVQMTFDVDDAYPLVSLVSMIAPSPDWFVGVAGLSMRENDAWVPYRVVDLHLYDAGTDSGISYGSPNQVTTPHVPIAMKTDGAFAASNLVGTFTFVQTSVLDAPKPPAAGEVRLVSLGPNPLTESARFELRIPAGQTGELEVYGIRGERVRALFSGSTSGQPHVVTWNTRDERGAPVAPGAYFAALRIDGVTQRTVKLAVVR